MVGLHHNRDNKTFSINILILHGQSQSYTYPVKERDIIPLLPYIFLPDMKQSKEKTKTVAILDHHYYIACFPSPEQKLIRAGGDYLFLVIQ